MRKVSKEAKAVLNILTADLDGENTHLKIDNTNGAFMPVSVNFLGETELGPIFSVTHYGEQNGDLMSDPDMTFLKGGDGNYYPGSFRNDYIGLYQECLWIDGSEVKFAPRLQRELASFTTTWMRNIREQQGLVAVSKATSKAA